MKKILIITFLLFVGGTLTAQFNRENFSFMKLNYGYALNPSVIQKWSPASFEVGGRFYLTDNGLFTDGSILGFRLNSKFWGTYHERGLGLSNSIGYDFIISEKISAELFIGLQFRQSLYRDHLRVVRKNFLWNSGVGFSFGKFNFCIGLNRSLIDRKIPHQYPDFRAEILYVGLSYRFSFRKAFLGVDD